MVDKTFPVGEFPIGACRPPRGGEPSSRPARRPDRGCVGRSRRHPGPCGERHTWPGAVAAQAERGGPAWRLLPSLSLARGARPRASCKEGRDVPRGVATARGATARRFRDAIGRPLAAAPHGERGAVLACASARPFTFPAGRGSPMPATLPAAGPPTRRSVAATTGRSPGSGNVGHREHPGPGRPAADGVDGLGALDTPPYGRVGPTGQEDAALLRGTIPSR